MPTPPKAAGFVLAVIFCVLTIVSIPPLLCQQVQVLGSIFGRIHLGGGRMLPESVLVELEARGAPVKSLYTDSQGAFSFGGLPPDPYTVVIDDEKYQPVHRSAVITSFALSPQVVVDITLIPKPPELGKGPARPLGSNCEITDVREYSKKFSKHVLKEFAKGVDADRNGRREDAIRHYQRAVQLAPDFYPAHNNLGSDYLAKSDFPAARKEFEQVVELNQSDSEAYFNLSNVCILMGQLKDSQQYLDQGMRRQPDSALGHFLVGSLAIKTGKLQQAEAALRQTVQLSPTMEQARLQLVNLMLQEGRKSEAADELQEFMRMFPESSFVPKARQLLQKLQASKPAAASK